MERNIHDDVQLMQLIDELGFLPLLGNEIRGFSAEEWVDDDCRYVVFPDGGWDWPLWKWKGPIVTAGNCVYGKFFDRKAGFISKQWWPDFYNYRRNVHPAPEEGSVEEAILVTLKEKGSLITRQLRAECGFAGSKMRGRFDAYVTRLQMGCYIVTEDFVYPRDRHNREYGWGWSLLSTPERLLGKDACACQRSPQESFRRMWKHIKTLLPMASDRQILKILR